MKVKSSLMSAICVCCAETCFGAFSGTVFHILMYSDSDTLIFLYLYSRKKSPLRGLFFRSLRSQIDVWHSEILEFGLFTSPFNQGVQSTLIFEPKKQGWKKVLPFLSLLPQAAKSSPFLPGSDMEPKPNIWILISKIRLIYYKVIPFCISNSLVDIP